MERRGGDGGRANGRTQRGGRGRYVVRRWRVAHAKATAKLHGPKKSPLNDFERNVFGEIVVEMEAGVVFPPKKILEAEAIDKGRGDEDVRPMREGELDAMERAKNDNQPSDVLALGVKAI